MDHQAHQMGDLRWAPDVTGEKILITNAAAGNLTPGRLSERPTLYHVAIKAGLYRKAVQVYHTYTYYYFIFPLHFKIRPRISI